MKRMTPIQELAYRHACARATDIDTRRFFHRIDNRVTVGLTVNK